MACDRSPTMLEQLRHRLHASASLRLVTLLVVASVLGGCAAFGSAAASRVTDGLAVAILDADDPELVREGMPAYLILLDALVQSDPGNPRFLGAAAQLYAAYGLVFVTDEQRAQTLTSHARGYGAGAICAADRHACGLDDLDYDAFVRTVGRIGANDAEALYSYCVGSLAYVRAHSSDWTAIAALPRIEHALQRLLAVGQSSRAVSVNTYLGVLNTLRPEALGGRPEQGRSYFEKAIELSQGRDLTAKTEFARGYARLVYDRELHDRLLNEVLQAPARQPGMTLFNTLAQQQARELLATADDYF
jgi:hypothetical protein